MPKFGEWDVNDPTSAEGFTVIFNKARDEKKTGGKPDSPGKVDAHGRNAPDPAKTPPVRYIHNLFPTWALDGCCSYIAFYLC